MTARPHFTKAQLAAAADVVREKCVTIIIEAPNGAIYRIAPENATVPVGREEKDAAACDQAFGIGS